MKRSLLLVLLVASGCAPVGGSGNNRGRADTTNSVEAGPLEDVPHVVHAGTPLAFRVEGYGATALELDAAGAQLTVEGPLGDPEPAPGAATPVDSAADHLSVTLGAGVYRVLVDGETTLTGQCTAGCAHTVLSAQDFAAQLIASGRLQPLVDQLRQKLAVLAPDPGLRAMLDQQLAQLTTSQDLSFLARFPTVPLATLGQLRPALGLVPAQPSQPDAVVDGELADLLGSCDVPRAMPDPISSLPGVGYGHYPNRALTDCQAAHSTRLAQILTSLAAQNGSRVTYHGQSLTTPDQLFAALLDSGHTIETRNERTYANFLSFALVDQNVETRWPVWIDTGLALADGSTVKVPMGHSHHAWRIVGPDVDARVSFFLGMSGAGFFAQTDTRPAWTGYAARSVDTARDHVLAAVSAAASYLRRNRVERDTLAQGLPADGYGYLGVCNDSNAIIESLTGENDTGETTTVFPLLRAASLDGQAELGDGLDAAIRALPHDADQAPSLADGLARVLEMSPHPLGSPLFPDDDLRAQLQEVARELGR
jgi:hypothetical protein